MKTATIGLTFFLLLHKWVYERVMKLILGPLIWNEQCSFEVAKFDLLPP